MIKLRRNQLHHEKHINYTSTPCHAIYLSKSTVLEMPSIPLKLTSGKLKTSLEVCSRLFCSDNWLLHTFYLENIRITCNWSILALIYFNATSIHTNLIFILPLSILFLYNHKCPHLTEIFCVVNVSKQSHLEVSKLIYWLQEGSLLWVPANMSICQCSLLSGYNSATLNTVRDVFLPLD